MTGPIQKADAAARLRLVKWLITVALAGFVLLIFADDLAGGITSWTFGAPEQTPRRIAIFVVGLCGLSVVPLLLIAIYLLRYAAAVAGAARYPPPGWPVTRDTRVVEGSRALGRARTLRMLAITIGILGLVMVYLYWRLWNVLGALPVGAPVTA